MILRIKGLAVAGSCVALALSGCTFKGVNSLPLPGAVGQGSDAVKYNFEVANVATLESNSPVLISDVVVGSVGKMTVDNWHANVEISVRPDVVIPANVVPPSGRPACWDRCIWGSIRHSDNSRAADCNPVPPFR